MKISAIILFAGVIGGLALIAYIAIVSGILHVPALPMGGR